MMRAFGAIPGLEQRIAVLLSCFLLSSIAIGASRPNVIVVLTDDHGWADLGIQGVVEDVRTPNLDQLAREGVRFTNGYVTSPQCTPSRAGLLSGQYQQRFGLDDNEFPPLSRDVMLLPERLKRLGYRTGMAGKWHLEINRLARDWLKAHHPHLEAEEGVEHRIPFDELIDYFPHARGFTDVYFGYDKQWWVNFDLEGHGFDEPRYVTNEDYRLDVVSDAAVAFIDRHHEGPFFLYLPYYGPHVPLDAPREYLDRFPGDMPERRRYCLAMLSAIDDGVGRVMDRLDHHGIADNTLVFFLGDNGAPLKMTKEDVPVSSPSGAWDGSLNDPLKGEKGMLSEGGIRVPFIARWKSRIPAGQVIDDPVIALDISATVMALSGRDVPGNADGVDLMPLMTGSAEALPERSLYWKFWSQRALRRGQWKYLEVGEQTEFLFDLSADPQESANLIDAHREIAEALRRDLDGWTTQLMHPERYDAGPEAQEIGWYRFFFGMRPR